MKEVLQHNPANTESDFKLEKLTPLEKLEAAKAAHDAELAIQFEELHDLFHTKKPTTLAKLTAKKFPNLQGAAPRIREIHTLYHRGKIEEAKHQGELLKGFEHDLQNPVTIKLNWDQIKFYLWLQRTHEKLPETTQESLTTQPEVV